MLEPLRIRKKLGRDVWKVPTRFGPDGWLFEDVTGAGRIIVTCGPIGESDEDWVHASMSLRMQVPNYPDLTHLHAAVFGDGYAYQVFAPPEDHINIHERTLHLWGRLDGSRALPDFGALGTI